MKTFQLPASKKTKVISRLSSSIPQKYQLKAVPTKGQTLSGTIEVKGSHWIFPKQAEILPLEPETIVTAGYWDSFFSVYVESESEVELHVSSPSKGFSKKLTKNIVWYAVIMTVIIALEIIYLKVL